MRAIDANRPLGRRCASAAGGRIGDGVAWEVAQRLDRAAGCSRSQLP
jgi:hypothetical protein